MTLEEVRKSKDLSQQELGQLLGVSRVAVNLWERGKAIPNARNMASIANWSGLSIEEVYGMFDVATA